MDYLEFFLFAEEHLQSQILFATLLLIGYLLIYKNHYQSVFDPFFLIVVICGLSTSTVFFLYFNNAIKSIYFYQFVVTEFAFILGFMLIKPIQFKKQLQNQSTKETNYFNKDLTNVLFYLASLIHISFQFLTYFVVGIPLFLDSRLETFTGGGGFGFVGRIIEVASGIGIFLLFYRIFYTKNTFLGKSYNYLYLFLVVLFLLLSGSKTNLFFLVFYMFLVNLYMAKIKGIKASHIINKISKYQKILIIISLPIIFLVMYIQLVNSGASTEDRSPLVAFAQRVISFGDIYYMTFPNDVIKLMNNDSGFLQLFKDPLGMFRILPWEKLPLDCGIEIQKYYYPDGALSGPNARYNYFSILYFNQFGQIVYCFFLGLFTSFMRNTLFKMLPNEIIFGAIYSIFSINLIYIFQDQSYTIARFLNIIIFFPILLIFAMIFQHVMGFRQNKANK